MSMNFAKGTAKKVGILATFIVTISAAAIGIASHQPHETAYISGHQDTNAYTAIFAKGLNQQQYSID